MRRCCRLAASGRHCGTLHIQVSVNFLLRLTTINVYNALSILCLSSFSSNTNTYRTAGEFVIVMGSTYLQSSDANTLQYYVQEVIVHPLFHYNSLNNDIAVMFINGYIPWQAKAVKALPLQNSSLPVSTSCVVTGWGVLSDVSVLYLLHIYVCSFVYRFACLPANQRIKGYYNYVSTENVHIKKPGGGIYPHGIGLSVRVKI